MGGALFAAGRLSAMGFVALAHIAMSFGLLWLTRSTPDAPGSASMRLSGADAA
jgi:hypothetical protein